MQPLYPQYQNIAITTRHGGVYKFFTTTDAYNIQQTKRNETSTRQNITTVRTTSQNVNDHNGYT